MLSKKASMHDHDHELDAPANVIAMHNGVEAAIANSCNLGHEVGVNAAAEPQGMQLDSVGAASLALHGLPQKGQGGLTIMRF